MAVGETVNDLYRAIGRRLRAAREAYDLTQEAVAHRLHVEAQSYSRYESGERRISITTLRRAAEILGRPMAYFLGTTEPNPEELWLHELLALPPELRERAFEHLRYLRHTYDQELENRAAARPDIASKR